MGKKLCECGCGKPAPIATKTAKKYGHVKGQPTRFILGHHKVPFNWKGGVAKTADGRIRIWRPDHPKAGSDGYILRSRLIAEKALGKPLPDMSVVHHFNKNVDNDKSTNLVLCEDVAYHNLLHRRQRAYEACGQAHWRLCKYCKKYDDPENLHIHNSPGTRKRKSPNVVIYHRTCYNQYMRNWRIKSGRTKETMA